MKYPQNILYNRDNVQSSQLPKKTVSKMPSHKSSLIKYKGIEISCILSPHSVIELDINGKKIYRNCTIN